MTQEAKATITCERAVRAPEEVKHFIAELLRYAPALAENTPVVVVEPDRERFGVRITVYSEWTDDYRLPQVLGGTVRRVAESVR